MKYFTLEDFLDGTLFMNDKLKKTVKQRLNDLKKNYKEDYVLKRYINMIMKNRLKYIVVLLKFFFDKFSIKNFIAKHH